MTSTLLGCILALLAPRCVKRPALVIRAWYSVQQNRPNARIRSDFSKLRRSGDRRPGPAAHRPARRVRRSTPGGANDVQPPPVLRHRPARPGLAPALAGGHGPSDAGGIGGTGGLCGIGGASPAGGGGGGAPPAGPAAAARARRRDEPRTAARRP